MRLEAERADQSHYSLLHGSDSCGEDINQEIARDWCSYHFSIIKIKNILSFFFFKPKLLLYVRSVTEIV